MGNIIQLIVDFLAIGPVGKIHVIVYQPDGDDRQLILPVNPLSQEEPEQTETLQIAEAFETLRQKLERIISSPDLGGEDLEWWKQVQLKLQGDQILPSDTVDQAIEKLKKIGVEE